MATNGNPDFVGIANRTGKWTLATCSWPAGIEYEEVKANAALIVRAVNEYDALNAIAEAAEWLLDEFRSRTALIETCDLDPDELAAMNKTEQALSTLAKLREGKE